MSKFVAQGLLLSKLEKQPKHFRASFACPKDTSCPSQSPKLSKHCYSPWNSEVPCQPQGVQATAWGLRPWHWLQDQLPSSSFRSLHSAPPWRHRSCIGYPTWQPDFNLSSSCHAFQKTTAELSCGTVYYQQVEEWQWTPTTTPSWRRPPFGCPLVGPSFRVNAGYLGPNTRTGIAASSPSPSQGNQLLGPFAARYGGSAETLHMPGVSQGLLETSKAFATERGCCRGHWASAAQRAGPEQKQELTLTASGRACFFKHSCSWSWPCRNTWAKTYSNSNGKMTESILAASSFPSRLRNSSFHCSMVFTPDEKFWLKQSLAITSWVSSFANPRCLTASVRTFKTAAGTLRRRLKMASDSNLPKENALATEVAVVHSCRLPRFKLHMWNIGAYSLLIWHATHIAYHISFTILQPMPSYRIQKWAGPDHG